MGDKKKKKKRKKSSSSSSSSSKRKPSADRKPSTDPEVGPDEFLVTLDMTKKKGLGIEVDWANGKSLLVKNVKPEGHIPDWNKEQTPDKQIMAEDHVIAVNGKAGDPKSMLNECRNAKKLKLLVWAHCVRSAEPQRKRSPKAQALVKPDQQRLADAEAQLQESLARVQQKRRGVPDSPEFLVALDMRRHAQLGLDVDWSNGKTLYIKAVLSGAIEEWNRVCPPERDVNPGDTVVAVNGYAGDARGMAGLCKELCGANSQLHLRVRGPPFPPPNAPLQLMVS